MPAWLAWPVIKTFLGGAFAKAWAALKSFFAALNIQGWVGLAAACFLGWHWWGSASDARHWKRESGIWTQAYTLEKKAFDLTKANLLAAAAKAKEEDAANARRVQAEQQAISERTANDYEARIAAARAQYERLQREAAAHSGRGSATPVPGVSAPPGKPPETPGQDGLSDRFICTAQSIQLDELQKWVRNQAAINPNEGKK